MFFNAPRNSGNWNLNPASRNFLGAQRRPVSASDGSVFIHHEPMLTAQTGAGGLHGRCNARRNSRMNSLFVTGFGPVALNAPDKSSRSIAWRNIRFMSARWIQLMYCRPLPTLPPRNHLVNFPSTDSAPPSRSSTKPIRSKTLRVFGVFAELNAPSQSLQVSVASPSPGEQFSSHQRSPVSP